MNETGSSSVRLTPVRGGHGDPKRTPGRLYWRSTMTSLACCDATGWGADRNRRIVAAMSTLATTPTVLVREDGPAARVTLNRAEKRNALSLELMEELLETLQRLRGEPGVRAIVLEGAGPAFSAGHDLSEMIDRDREFLAHLFDRCSEMMGTLHDVPQP